MKGDNPTLNDGIKCFRTVHSFVVHFVRYRGLVLIIFDRRSLKIVVWIVGALWSLATFLSFVLVLENLSVGKGIKRSKEIFENMGRKFRRRT